MDQNYESIMQWRRRSNPSLIAIIQTMLGVARTIRYLHSMNIVLYFAFNVDDVFLDSESRPKIRYLGAASSVLQDNFAKGMVCYKNNIFSFGHIFYEVYFGVKSHNNFCRQDTGHLASEPRISMYARDLIQHCCAIDPKSRPTIDEVVKKIERWE
ncbi:Protein kinase-like domain containing protein [Amanita muscaria]